MFGLIALIASPALAQQKPGVIQVNSGSATGEIVLDGFPTGIMAPGKLESVPPGEHMIEVEYGCMLASGSVTVQPEETVEANLKVENRGGTGTIRVKDLPRGAEVLIDDAPVANVAEGVEAKCGARKLTVESPGFEPYEEMVVVSTGKWSTVEPQLIEAAMVDEPIERRDTYDDFDDGYDEPDFRDEYDDLDDLDALEGPDEYEAEQRRREEAARREAEQRAREEARRRAEEEARRAEQERLDRFGDIDSLDEPDEPVDEGRRGRKDKDDEDDRDAFDDLDDLGDDPDFDDPDDYDDYDEPDYYDDGFEDPDAMDDFREYDDLDGDERSSRPPKDDKPKKDRKPVPVRGLATAGGGVVGVTGIVVAATGASTMNEKKAEYTRVVEATNTTSPAALQLASDVDAAKGQRNLGIGLAVVGLGAGAASFALLPPAWNTSLVVAPTEDGGGMAMVTVEF